MTCPKDVGHRPARASAAELGTRAGIGFAEIGVTQGAPGDVKQMGIVVGCQLEQSRSADVYNSLWMFMMVCGSAVCLYLVRHDAHVDTISIPCCTVGYSCNTRQELFNNCDDDRSGFIEWPVPWCWNIWGALFLVRDRIMRPACSTWFCG